MIHYIEFKELLSSLIGEKVWKVRAGGVTGSVFTFEVGEQIIGKDRVKEGVYSFMIECAWRLGSEEKVITTWRDDSEPEGTMVKGLQLMEGEIINRIQLSIFFDLELHFESGNKLFVFCDYTNDSEFDTNWFFRVHKKYYSITNELKIEIEDSV